MPDELAGEASYPWKFRFSLLGEHSSVPFARGMRSLPLRLTPSGRARSIADTASWRPSPGHRYSSPTWRCGGRRNQVASRHLKALAETFWAEIERSGMQLDRDRTLAFLAAALSKPFVILTGQSGSGKTQLAQRLGEWCGVDSTGDHATP